jgi:hypothetical protein
MSQESTRKHWSAIDIGRGSWDVMRGEDATRVRYLSIYGGKAPHLNFNPYILIVNIEIENDLGPTRVTSSTLNDFTVKCCGQPRTAC